MCKFEKEEYVLFFNLDYMCLKPHVGIDHLEDAVRDGTFFHLGLFLQ